MHIVPYYNSVRNSKIFSSHLDNLNQNLGCPKNCLVVQSSPPRLRGGPYGRGAAEGPQKLWGKWCKILYSGHILAHKSQLQIGFFTEIFA